ncbi:hypothetical protein KEM56_004092 [Ascosphaera pollenicola]|nr:hypothetical protein KEM56_004092 [Ascosphaera pollenicola]
MIESDDQLHGTPVYDYHGLESIKRAIRQEVAKTIEEGAGAAQVVFKNVPTKMIKHLFTSDEVQLPSNTDFSAFDLLNQTITVKMPEHTAHGAAASAITDEVDRALENVGLRDRFQKTGAGVYHTPFTEVRGKQPDQAWMALAADSDPAKSEHWPRLVLEVGVSEPERELRADAQLWLIYSEGGVRIMLTANLCETTAILASWKRQGPDDVQMEQKVVGHKNQDGIWRVVSDQKTLHFAVKDVLGQDLAQEKDDLLVIKGDSLLKAAAASEYQRRMQEHFRHARD